jgi:hypothetical protein
LGGSSRIVEKQCLLGVVPDLRQVPNRIIAVDQILQALCSTQGEQAGEPESKRVVVVSGLHPIGIGYQYALAFGVVIQAGYQVCQRPSSCTAQGFKQVGFIIR